MQVAVIGSGIAGLGAAWQLRDTASVTVFEKNSCLGGHSHTVMAPGDVPVDTGFIVYNQRTYPNLIALFDTLGTPTIPSDMSFAASLDEGRVEYAGDTLGTLVGHWQNLLRPRHWRMVADLVRFLRNGHLLGSAPADMTLGAFLHEHRYSEAFRDDHLLPMAGAIWSASPAAILEFPARSFGEFFRNHGLLELDTAKRPPWRTVAGGSRSYVEQLVAASEANIVTDATIERVNSSGDKPHLCLRDGSVQGFDHVIIATHADEALRLLPTVGQPVRDVLQAFRYSANDTYLHSDATLMPQRRRLWASWNYLRQGDPTEARVFVSYWMNRLQTLDTTTDYFVSLNPPQPPEPGKTILHQVYHHPQFDLTALAAQSALRLMQGQNGIWLCGSYFGYGFHEDALASGLAVASALGAPRAWTVQDISPAFANATPGPAS